MSEEIGAPGVIKDFLNERDDHIAEARSLVDALRGQGRPSCGCSLATRAADTIEALVKERDEARFRADEAWGVIKADYWRNRYDEDMAAGNAVVAAITEERDALAAVVENANCEVEHYLTSIGMTKAVSRLRRILSAAPADALAEHEARLIERLADKLNSRGLKMTATDGAALDLLRISWVVRGLMDAVGYLRDTAIDVRRGEGK